MTDQQSSTDHPTTTSAGHQLSESTYLDSHFEAMRPEYEAMTRSVGIKPGWQVLDAGCGGGSFLPILAELVGPSGHISAFDLAPENIEVVDALVEAGKFACSIETKIGNATVLPYEDNTFDAVWCAAVSQYLTDQDLKTMLAEHCRVVRPNGLVVLKDFDLTGLQFYPFDPILLWHLLEALRPHDTQIHGGLRAIELPTWFKETGLTDVRYQTTLCERRAPLRPVERQFISDALGFIAAEAKKIGIPEAELSAWLALNDPNAPDYPLKHPDFYWREGHVVVIGRVPE